MLVPNYAFVCQVVLLLCAVDLISSSGAFDDQINQVPPNNDKGNNKKSKSPVVPVYGGLFQKTPVLRKDFSTLSLLINADKVSEYLRMDLANSELRVLTLQKLFDKLNYDHVKIERKKTVEKVSDDLDKVFRRYLKVLNRSRTAVQDLYATQPNNMFVFIPYMECCELDFKNLKYLAQYSAWVNNSYSCDIVSYSRSHQFAFYPKSVLTPVFKTNARDLVGLRWQYFISPEGSHIEYPAHSLSSQGEAHACLLAESRRHRAQFVASALPYRKHVVILFDHGSSLPVSQLAAAKSLIVLLLESFSRRDQVTVLALSNKVQSVCDNTLLGLNWETKQRLETFVNRLSSVKEQTNHSLGFHTAYDILKKSRDEMQNSELQTDGARPFIFYVSRGLLSSLQEAGQVLQTIAELNLQTQLLVEINTFVVIQQKKIPLWETQFLDHVAKQKFSPYQSTFPADLVKKIQKQKLVPPEGKMEIVNGTEGSVLPTAKVYKLLKLPEADLERSYRTHVLWSEPHLDPDGMVHKPDKTMHRSKRRNGADLWESLTRTLIGISVPVWHGDRFIGVLGADVAVGSLVSNLQYFSTHEPNSYMFLLEQKTGLVMGHPNSGSVPYPARVDTVEDWPTEVVAGPRSLLHKMVYADGYESSDVSQASVRVTRYNKTVKMIYYWKKVPSAPYIVVYATSEPEDSEVLKATNVDHSSIKKFLTYHRLDLDLHSKVNNYCMNLKQLSAKDFGSVYLGPGAFDSPYNELILRSESRLIASSHWAFLSVTQLIPNPGIKEGIKDQVAILADIVPEWRDRALHSKLSGNILRRYVATQNGVLVSYPAGLLDSRYDPTKRQWYRRALQHPGEIVLTGPYLDPAGGGYIVSLSHTVYEGKTALHMPTDRVVAVAGMDFPLGFFYRQLTDIIPHCRQPAMTCIVFDDKGYVVAYGNSKLRQGQTAPGSREPLEAQHLIHREPLLAGDLLLKHPDLVKKVQCRRSGHANSQRIYRFNTSLHEVLKGEDALECTSFQLAHVARTNSFLVMLNHTCSKRHSAFCPCSVNGRKCMNCDRWDPLDCECPCECPLSDAPWWRTTCPRRDADERNAVTAKTDGRLPKSAVECDPAETEFALPYVDTSVLVKLMPSANAAHDIGFPQCVKPVCSRYSTSEQRCLGLVGCEWCFRDSDGVTELKRPFCSDISACFLGVRGRTPDGENFVTEEALTVSTPVGPVAGAIMVVFALLVVAVYCYRHQMARLIEGRGGSNGSGQRLHLAGVEEEEEYQFDHNGSGANGDAAGTGSSHGVNHILLASFEKEIPRAVNRAWRPGPRTAESSDHGYSTMTGNCDDSEQATTIEPLAPHPAHSHKLKLGRLIGRKATSAPTTTTSVVGLPAYVTRSKATADGGGQRTTKLLLTLDANDSEGIGSDMDHSNTTIVDSSENKCLPPHETTMLASDKVNLDSPESGAESGGELTTVQTELNQSELSTLEQPTHLTIQAQVHAVDANG